MCPEISPDFSEISELKPGTYKARLTDVELKEAQKGGHYLRWKLEVFGNEDTKLNGRTFTYMTMITGPGAKNFRNLVRATINPSYEGGPVKTEDMQGKELQVVLKQGKDREGNPSDFPEVASVARLG